MIQGSESVDQSTIITAEVPLSEMFGYSQDIRSSTEGKGTFSMEFVRYAAVPKDDQTKIINEYLRNREEANA